MNKPIEEQIIDSLSYSIVRDRKGLDLVRVAMLNDIVQFIVLSDLKSIVKRKEV